MILRYKRVQGGIEGTSVRKDAGKEESDVLNTRRNVPTASPAPPVAAHLQAFSRSISALVCRPSVDHYRPPSYVPTACRPHKNSLFCRSFIQHLTPAVGAVDILASFTDGL
jgi:hypothetical protein